MLDRGAVVARDAGEIGLAARLTVEAADVACDLVRLVGGHYNDAMARSRAALDDLRGSGDRRRYVAAMPSFVATLGIDSPAEALHLAVETAKEALEIGDFANHALLSYATCNTAIDTADLETLHRWLPILLAAPLDAIKRLEAEELAGVVRALSEPVPGLEDEFLALADRFVELGEASRANMPEGSALCSILWRGRTSQARALLEERVGDHLSTGTHTLYELVIRALEGPPWRLDGVEFPDLTIIHNERALLHLLRDEHTEADALFRERYAERMSNLGSGRQRFSPYFPGALVAALGPVDTEPDVAWLLGWIHEPPFPGVWIAHRAVCALLLGERAEPPEPGLAEVARRLIESTDADDSVRRWITERAERSGAAGRDRRV